MFMNATMEHWNTHIQFDEFNVDQKVQNIVDSIVLQTSLWHSTLVIYAVVAQLHAVIVFIAFLQQQQH